MAVMCLRHTVIQHGTCWESRKIWRKKRKSIDLIWPRNNKKSGIEEVPFIFNN